MLIEFSSKAYENIVMFEQHALRLLHMMGLNTKIPGAILAKDVAQALMTLEKALAHDEHNNAIEFIDEENEDEVAVSLKQRAFPLIAMLQHAIVQSVDVLWDYY